MKAQLIEVNLEANKIDSPKKIILAVELEGVNDRLAFQQFSKELEKDVNGFLMVPVMPIENVKNA